MARLARRIRQVARELRVDVIHAHSPLLNGLPAIWVGRRLGIRTVYEVRTFWEDAAVSHGTHREGSLRYRVSRALERVVLQRADAVVAICGGIRSELIRRGIDAERITVVPNGVDPDWLASRPRAVALADQLGIGDGPVFGYIGSFSHYEGLSFLLEAAPAFMGTFSGSRLLLVGDGRDRRALDEAARRAGPGVIMTGRLPQQAVRDVYTLLDVFVLPRRRIRLTEMVTPLKPLEAMAAGTAVLASDIGGHTELIDDGHTGLLFETESPESLAKQAIRLGTEPELRRHLVEGGRRFVARERTWDRIVAGYLPVYEGAR
jgi:PEP-CTERM/exosortase A-associated glycosyltransferase